MKVKSILYFLGLFALVFFYSHTAHAAGVEDLLSDFSDYISSRLIPVAGAVGVGVGSVMTGLGSPKGVEVIKYSVIGGIVGTAGAETLRALFF